MSVPFLVDYLQGQNSDEIGHEILLQVNAGDLFEFSHRLRMSLGKSFQEKLQDHINEKETLEGRVNVHYGLVPRLVHPESGNVRIYVAGYEAQEADDGLPHLEHSI